MQHLREHELIRPLPVDVAGDDLTIGDAVEMIISDWTAGDVAIIATVTHPPRDGYVGLLVSVGSERRRYSAPVTHLRLIRRADA